MMFKEINSKQEKYLQEHGFEKLNFPDFFQYTLELEHGVSIYIKSNYTEFRCSIVGTYRGISVDEARLIANEINKTLDLIECFNKDMKELV